MSMHQVKAIYSLKGPFAISIYNIYARNNQSESTARIRDN